MSKAPCEVINYKKKMFNFKLGIEMKKGDAHCVTLMSLCHAHVTLIVSCVMLMSCHCVTFVSLCHTCVIVLHMLESCWGHRFFLSHSSNTLQESYYSCI